MTLNIVRSYRIYELRGLFSRYNLFTVQGICIVGNVMQKLAYNIIRCCEYRMNDHPEAFYQRKNFVSEEYNIKEYAASFK